MFQIHFHLFTRSFHINVELDLKCLPLRSLKQILRLRLDDLI